MSRVKGSKNPNGGRHKIPLIIEIPPKEIILEQVLYWIGLQATQEEVAGSFRVTVETLNARLNEHFGLNFVELKKRTDGEGKTSLRRYQFEQAKRNATMAIWLGKQWLGQKDSDKNEAAAPHDAQLDMIQQLIRENKELKDQLKELINAHQSKTASVLPGSN